MNSVREISEPSSPVAGPSYHSSPPSPSSIAAIWERRTVRQVDEESVIVEEDSDDQTEILSDVSSESLEFSSSDSESENSEDSDGSTLLDTVLKFKKINATLNLEED